MGGHGFKSQQRLLFGCVILTVVCKILASITILCAFSHLGGHRFKSKQGHLFGCVIYPNNIFNRSHVIYWRGYGMCHYDKVSLTVNLTLRTSISCAQPGFLMHQKVETHQSSSEIQACITCSFSGKRKLIDNPLVLICCIEESKRGRSQTYKRLFLKMASKYCNIVCELSI